MPDSASRPCTAFDGMDRLVAGPLRDVALAVKAALAERPAASVLTFDDRTGSVVDLDLRGGEVEVLARLDEGAPSSPPADESLPRMRGRPRLGVIAREVTLLPRHWDWLAAQRGGASQALRRLVDDARRADEGRYHARTAQEAAYRFMAALAGDLPGFEEATRALFAADRDRFAEQTAGWPEDVRTYARKLASI